MLTFLVAAVIVILVFLKIKKSSRLNESVSDDKVFDIMFKSMLEDIEAKFSNEKDADMYVKNIRKYIFDNLMDIGKEFHFIKEGLCVEYGMRIPISEIRHKSGIMNQFIILTITQGYLLKIPYSKSRAMFEETARKLGIR